MTDDCSDRVELVLTEIKSYNYALLKEFYCLTRVKSCHHAHYYDTKVLIPGRCLI